MAPDFPTRIDLERAHEAFRANEPRDLFYRAATELTELALAGRTSLTLSEALAILLQTWNKAYYRYKRFDRQHFRAIECLLSEHKAPLARFRMRDIDGLLPHEAPEVEGTFQAFENVLGPVGAAKALHVQAHRFFPLWDGAIARAYSLKFGRAGTNGHKYFSFMSICRQQIARLGGIEAAGDNPLKALDEYNYCKYTTHWM